MTYLLSEQGRQTLLEHLRQQPLLAFDLDGTLAPITEDPAKAALSTRVRSLLSSVARRFPVVVLSGRARRDAWTRLQGIAVREVYGNHGIEPTHASEELRQLVAGWGQRIARWLSTWEGVWLEDKQYSLTVHFRNSPVPELAREAAREAALHLGSVRILPGKLCLNILPSGIAHKGQALVDAQRRFAAGKAVYIGDDETDEDVFAACDLEHVLGVRVGRIPGSRAAYYLHSQSEVEQVLQVVAEHEG